jgi:8-hydroxy-5-deazaflavin:NADPH oxidoreductase
VRVAVIGAGRIGGNVARQAARAGHDVRLAYSRDPGKLAAFADELGGEAASPADAVSWAELVVFAVRWDSIEDALAQMGPLDSKIVVDTTNQFGSGPMPAEGQTAAAFNAARMPGARYTKSFNTLTSAFQAATAGRSGDERVVQWICGDDAGAKSVVAGLLEDMGYAPVDLAGIDDCGVMEAPRRPGAVYGEEWRLPEAQGVVDAVRRGEDIPPTPGY